MTDLFEEFQYRKSFVLRANFLEATTVLAGFYEWLISIKEIEKLINTLTENVDINEFVYPGFWGKPPQIYDPQQNIALGFYIFKQLHDGLSLDEIRDKYNLRSVEHSNDAQKQYKVIFLKYIHPCIEYLEKRLKKDFERKQLRNNFYKSPHPLEITESLKLFKKDNPIYETNAFIMMQFGTTVAHQNIVESIRQTLRKYGINALRADDKEFHDDLFINVLTYIHGCKFGVAVFEKLEKDDFNPNVSFEVGYMRGLRKSICLLKEKTLTTLHTDLIGKLYSEFDPQDCEKTIPRALEKWLRDKDMITL